MFGHTSTENANTFYTKSSEGRVTFPAGFTSLGLVIKPRTAQRMRQIRPKALGFRQVKLQYLQDFVIGEQGYYR
jgi:hypothetical protein